MLISPPAVGPTVETRRSALTNPAFGGLYYSSDSTELELPPSGPATARYQAGGPVGQLTRTGALSPMRRAAILDAVDRFMNSNPSSFEGDRHGDFVCDFDIVWNGQRRHFVRLEWGDWSPETNRLLEEAARAVTDLFQGAS